jgi:hypothetical protein
LCTMRFRNNLQLLSSPIILFLYGSTSTGRRAFSGNGNMVVFSTVTPM